MNAFHVFWTPSDKERVFDDYFVLTLILSALQWKLTNSGKLTFYGDKKTVAFLEKYRLTHLWDQCDGETLDQTINQNHYDTSTFVTIGKFAAFLKEKAPCAMIDVDLVIWENLALYLKGKKPLSHTGKMAAPILYGILVPTNCRVQTDINFILHGTFTAWLSTHLSCIFVRIR